MSTSISTRQARSQLLARLFPEGTPLLWCPPITHYTNEGAIDRARMAAHFQFMSPWIKGYLVPGSTGDGWELSASESRRVLEFALHEARRLRLHILVGALRATALETRRTIGATLDFLKEREGASSTEECLTQNRACGFAVCPPRGQELSQATLGEGLTSILETQAPIALYQLPQVTLNEMSPELMANLARQFGNFILFKDTSGADRVAQSGQTLEGVILVRGAEGDYARWLDIDGGAYQGFLLSSANCFGCGYFLATTLRHFVD